MIYGIDIGGTKIEIAVFDAAFEAVDRWRIATPKAGYDAFVAAIAGLVDEADRRYGGRGTVGLGIPGLVTRDGRSLSANVPSTNGRAVAADVAAAIGRPVSSDNDCRCFALSEATGGAGEGHAVVFGAILGTGAAGGIVVDGALLRGRQGIAGEFGHVPLSALVAERYGLPALPCGCGLTGCAEVYLAGPGLLRLSERFGRPHDDVPSLVRGWREGGDTERAAFRCYLDVLGSTFAAIVMMVDPDMIVLGGGLSLIDELLEQAPAAIGRHLFGGFTAPPVVRARFGDASGARGAALLAAGSAA